MNYVATIDVGHIFGGTSKIFSESLFAVTWLGFSIIARELTQIKPLGYVIAIVEKYCCNF